LKPDQKRKQLRESWARLLGDIKPHRPAKVVQRETRKVDGVSLERVLLEVEPGIHVPILVLLPADKGEKRVPVAVGVAQEGKATFLKGRADVIAGLLGKGAAVCLVDVRGTGETRPGSGRGRTSSATALAASEWMLGQTLVGSRLRDLRSVLDYLRGRADLDPKRLLLWGDSFAPTNAADAVVEVPADPELEPRPVEPLGSLLALFGGLFEEDVRGVYLRGGLLEYRKLLSGPFVHVAPDAIVPGALTAGSLVDVAVALPAPRWFEGLVDGVNRPESLILAKLTFRGAVKGGAEGIEVRDEATSAEVARWMTEQLSGK